MAIYEHEKTDTLVKRTSTAGPCLSQFTPFICPSVRRTSLPGPIREGGGPQLGEVTRFGGRHVPIALENSPKSAQNMAKKCSNSAGILKKRSKVARSC